MKKSISNFWLLSLVIVFIFIFSAYLIITLNYAKAFKVKNEVLSIIEKKKGISSNATVDSVSSRIPGVGGNVKVPKSALGVINVYLYASGYKVQGNCDLNDGGVWYGVKKLMKNNGNPDVSSFELITGANRNKKYYYCFSKRMNICSEGCNVSNSAIPYFYNVLLFYKMELPVLGDLFTFRVKGTTDEIFYDVADGSISCTCT